MKSNALLFPCDVELLSMIEYIDFGDYTISGLVVLENSNAFATDDINIPIIDVTDVKYDAFDNGIVIEPDFYKHSFIENSIKKGKNVIYIGQKEKEDFDFKRLELISEEQQISVPIVFVVGTAPYTEKFQIQLALRKQLLANGYKVSSIGSKPYSSLFGFHSFPFFMNENKDDTQKIILFKKYVKCIEMTEQPDLIVIGIPGAIMAINKKHHFDYGVTAYMVSQAVAGDYVIMNMLYGKKYTTEQLEELSKVCKYRLNFEVDSFHLSNAWLDPSTLKDDQLRIIKLGKKEYDQNVDRLYDLMNPTDMDRVYEDMITKLASYNVNQIF